MKGKAIVQAFENSDALLSFSFPELAMPLWPFVRFSFLDLYSAYINNLSPTNSVHNNKSKYVDFLKSLAKCAYKNPYLINSKDVLFFNSSITNIELDNGKYFNRVSDYFYYQLEGKAALIEDLLQFKTVSPRVHSDVYSILPFKLGSQLLASYPKLKLSSKSYILVEQLIGYLKSAAPLEAPEKFWQDCYTLFVRRIVKAQAEFKLYRHFLESKLPRLVFVEDAAYGSKLPLLLAAKSLRIPVAELQHGLVNENHLAYQFGEGVAVKLMPYLPDYFLSYSKYWSNSINLPSHKVEIGNPYLEEFLQKYPKKTSNKVLILGTGMSKDQLISFCKLLCTNHTFADFKFVLRPHPWEKNEAAEKYAELLALGYELDTLNLYESLSTSAVVFGEMSTAIYEASIYKIPVYLIATAHCLTNLTDTVPFSVISIDSEVSKKDFMKNSDSLQNEIWSSAWQSNFHDFVSGIIK